MANKKNELALVGEFRIATPYEGLSEEDLAELKDQMEDLEDESGISCRMIKIPAGGKLAYEVQGDEEGVPQGDRRGGDLHPPAQRLLAERLRHQQ